MKTREIWMHSTPSNSLPKIKILVYKTTIPYQYQITGHLLFLQVFLLSQHGRWWKAVNILSHLTRIMRTYTAVNAWCTAVSKIALYTIIMFSNAVLYILFRFGHVVLYTLFRYSHAVKLLCTTHTDLRVQSPAQAIILICKICGHHSSEYAYCCALVCDVMSTGRKVYTLQKNFLSPSSRGGSSTFHLSLQVNSSSYLH